MAAAPYVFGTHIRCHRLWMRPTPHQEWGDAYEERAAEWWELFLDLVLVAACAVVADALHEHRTPARLWAFLVQFLLFQTSWHFLTHFSTRFSDESLAKTYVTLVYIVSLAAMAVHADALAALRGFLVAMVVQRLALLCLYGAVVHRCARGRTFARFVSGVLCLSVGLCAAAYAGLREPASVLAALTLVALVELLWVPVVARWPQADRAAINVEHQTGRDGCVVLVVLGESVVSAVIGYSALDRGRATAAYYACMAFAFLFTFSLAMVYFYAQPPREEHAYRQSSLRGVSLLYVHHVLWTALLLVSVGTKGAMAAAVRGRRLPHSDLWLLYGATAAALVALFALRCTHYSGNIPRASDSPCHKRASYVWCGPGQRVA